MLEQNTMKPLYEQLMDAIREDIRKQVYKPGDKLPTETELENIYSVSRITVRRAVKELCDENILIKKQGKGTFVLNREIRSHLEGIGGFHDALGGMQRASTELLSIDEVEAGSEFGDYLSMPASYPVIRIRRVLSADGAPVMLDTCYLPAFRYPGIRQHLTGNFSVYGILREEYGTKMTKAEKVLKVRRANGEEQRLLNCGEGDPVFDIFKIVYDENRIPVHVSISIMNGENTSYIISTDNRNHLKIKNRKKKVNELIEQP